ncbi:MAG TPA: hypothetical protein VGE37_12435, partial [Archangium sp.]
MRTLALVSILGASLALAAEPTCPDRVKRLGELSKTLKAPTGPRPTRIGLYALDETLPKTKDRTPVRIVDRSSATLLPKTLTQLGELARRTSVELCVETNQPITLVLGKEANPA